MRLRWESKSGEVFAGDLFCGERAVFFLLEKMLQLAVADVLLSCEIVQNILLFVNIFDGWRSNLCLSDNCYVHHKMKKQRKKVFICFIKLAGFFNMSVGDALLIKSGQNGGRDPLCPL